MKKIGRLRRVFMLLSLVFVLAFGLLMFLPTNVLYAEDTSTKGKSETTEQTDGTAGASQPKFEHYEPLPIKPIHREANNLMFGSGLGVAGFVIGGAFVMDKRKGN